MNVAEMMVMVSLIDLFEEMKIGKEVVKMMMKQLPVLEQKYLMMNWLCFVYVVDTKHTFEQIRFQCINKLLLCRSDIAVYEVVLIVLILPYMVVVHVMTFVSILLHNI
jgi:hypothetical protein